MNKKYKLILFALMLVLLPNFKVTAATQQTIMCFEDYGLYAVAWDDSINTEVSKDKMNIDAIKNSHLPYPNGIEDTKYQFSVSRLASKCYKEGSSIKTCPEESNAFTKIKDTYVNIDEESKEVKPTSNISIDFNGNGRFNVTLTDKFNGKYNIRYVSNKDNYNDYNSASAYAGQFLSKSGGKYHINGVEPNSPIALEFYQNDGGKCNGTFIGRIIIYTPGLESTYIDNPAVKNPAAYGCDAVRSYKPSNIKLNVTEFNNLKASMIPLCYKNKILYTESQGMTSEIQKDFEAIKSLFSGIPTARFKNSKGCSDDATGYTSQGYSSSGNWWSIACYENYTATGDEPKLVRAGDGFSYHSEFTITKTCTLVQHTYPVMKPECQDYCSCDCTWVGASGAVHEGNDAGPSDDFDKCVNTCDGGKYTQKCINSCYKEVYNKERDFTFSSNFSLNNRKSNIEFTSVDIDAGDLMNNAPDGWSVSTVPGLSASGRLPATFYTASYRGGGSCTCSVSSYCAAGHGSCTFHFWFGPSGCVNNPQALYDAEVAQAASEYNQYKAKAQEPVDIGTYSMTITDTYLNDGKYKFIVSENSDPALKMSVSRSTQEFGSSAKISIDLPLSYINKITGEAAYKTDDTSPIYTMDSRKATLVKENSFIEKLYYYTPGERKYYTNINSDNFNVAFLNNKPVFSDTITKNIKVESKNVGWANYSSTINCYYGVYNDYYSGDGCEVYCDPDTEICDCGIQYIFRPIITGQPTKVGDLFPNERNPRYNWSSKAIDKGNELYSSYGGKVNPISYTKWLEEVGREDYLYDKSSGEIDYEFILTPKSIKAIKQYNRDIESGGGTTDYNKDTNNNYLDYDLECANKNGRNVCLSKFLDDTSILMYSGGHTVTDRHNIAGCNNAKSNGTECDASIK